jgi:hypothetical protein
MQALASRKAQVRHTKRTAPQGDPKRACILHLMLDLYEVRSGRKR